MPKPELQKYGAPLYAVFWPNDYAFMCGGGNLGIENKIVVVRCTGGVLSDEVAKLNVGSDAPYRMAMHPSGRALVVGLTLGGMRLIEVRPAADAADPPALTLAAGDFDERSKRFGAVKALSFSADGRSLALGCEDGTLEIVSWPGLETKTRWQASPKGLRNVDFSAAHSDGVVASVDESGACKLWDVASGEMVAQLQPPPHLPRATFFRCKAAADARGIALYTPVKFRGEGYMLRWRQDDNGEIHLEASSSKPVTRSPICGFEVSPSGRLLAAVTPEGDQIVISAETLRPLRRRMGVHLTFATAVAFAPDESGVLSTSADASAVLTTLGKAGGSVGSGVGAGLLAALFAVLAVLLALLLSLARTYAVQQPEEAAAMLSWLPQQLRAVLLP